MESFKKLRWQPITSVEVKFVARQVEASVVIRATKQKFVAKVELESTFRNTSSQLATSYFVARQVGHVGGNTRNRELQLALQQCCKTSWRKMLPVLPDLNAAVGWTWLSFPVLLFHWMLSFRPKYDGEIWKRSFISTVKDDFQSLLRTVDGFYFVSCKTSQNANISKLPTRSKFKVLKTKS